MPKLLKVNKPASRDNGMPRQAVGVSHVLSQRIVGDALSTVQLLDSLMVDQSDIQGRLAIKQLILNAVLASALGVGATLSGACTEILRDEMVRILGALFDHRMAYEKAQAARAVPTLEREV